MLHLTPAQIQHAIGISGSARITLGAVTAGKLTMMKNTVDPMATQSGVFAALLAEKGYTGPEHVIDGKEGLVHCFGPDWKLETLTEKLGKSWRITQCGMKAFPTEALTHTPISAVLALVKDNDLQPAEIEKVHIRTTAQPGGGFEEPHVNVVVFRQNTEGLYAGVEWTNPPQAVRDALRTHPKFKPFDNVPGEDLAISVRIITRPAARRICEAAFQHARKFGYKSVTICEKPNVLRETSGMMEEVAKEIQKQHSDIALWSTNIDAQTMWLTKNPEDYGVIVASNLFGDVISDAFAGLVGGLGFAASGNIGEEVAVFEPTHGSAPKYAELDPPIVNPIAMILSAAMMLDHVGEREKAGQVRKAVAGVIAEGKVRTYDMMRLAGGAKSLAQGAASTTQMTEAILAKLETKAEKVYAGSSRG
jgi:isocitrate/isopropylmalate dehydrogenase